jgi:ABC-2 type transport system permease protein
VLAFSLSAMGVAVSARMRSMQGFQMVMNLLMMPMFFLGGSLFPLNSLPAWMTVLTRLDPVAYGIAPVRHVLLAADGVRGSALDQVAAVNIAGHTLPVLGEAAVLLAFGIVMLGFGVYGFRRRD